MTDKDPIFYMKKALEQAHIAFEHAEVPVGAIMVYQGEIIASAYNRREEKKDPLAHAEILVIAKAAEKLSTRRLTGCTLYVTLEPCPMCAGALLMAQIDQCVFGAYDSRQGCCGSIYNVAEDPAFYHHTVLIGGVLEKESQELLQRFFAQRREE
ncbi:MAG: nucleoside deaminase [Clostridiales bacterium]|nr:nucleoside deaminase [Clostridiales bacterium]